MNSVNSKWQTPQYTIKAVEILWECVKILISSQYIKETATYHFSYDPFIGKAVGDSDEESLMESYSYRNRFYHVVWIDCEKKAELIRRISLEFE